MRVKKRPMHSVMVPPRGWRSKQGLEALGALGLCMMTWSASAKDLPEPRELCPKILVLGKFKPDLTAAEKRLVCGDPENESGAWKNIPPPQARFNLRNFLQQRGYHHPKFEQEDHVTTVEIGRQTLIRNLSAEGAPESLRLERKRKIVGEPLTPARLGQVENWVRERLQASGYPCPEVRSTADPNTGEVILYVEKGPLQHLVSVTDEGIAGVEKGALRRVDAFDVGDPYNGDLMALTDARVTAQGMIQSSHFTPTCEPSGAKVHQEVVAGPSRQISVGFGLNTEGLILGRVNWRNTRLGERASRVDLSGTASAREQRLDAAGSWYPLSQPSRFLVRPRVTASHQNELSYEALSLRSELSMLRSYDWSRGPLGLGGRFRLGPVLDFFRTLRGEGPPGSRFLSLEAEVSLLSHQFELWAGEPREGYRVSLLTAFSDRNLGSDASLQRLNFMGELLLNFRDYDPPLFIFGLRGGYATLFSSERAGPSTLLPQQYLKYLGGSLDLRGWYRKELSVGGTGGMSSLYLGAEFRLGDVLPLNLQPFAFLDTGALGSEPLRLDRPIYVSPGLGLRVPSPIGVFRATLAHGFADGIPDHWQFFFSYGEEF